MPGALLSVTGAPQTPTADGAVVLLPPAAELTHLLAAARRKLSAMDFHVADVPAKQLRAECRRELAGRAGIDPAVPWIATGHQSEMHHAGVWFKDAAVAALAETAGGVGMHLVADQDTIKETELATPRLAADGLLQVEHLTFATPAGSQCPAQLPAPNAETFDRLVRSARDGVGVSDVFDVWTAAARTALDSAGSLAEWTATARGAVNRELGLRVCDMMMSRISRGRAFARFAADLAIRHREMFDLHRRVLAEHRAAHGITNVARPVSDLAADGDAVEVPLWAYRGGEGREPVFARATDDGVELRTRTWPIARLPRDTAAAVEVLLSLADRRIMLAPRALTLTMFVRAFLFDVFIHGTGGARYDLLGDELTQQWYRWRPPPFVTVTATAQIDCPRFDTTAADRAAARWDSHHAWHNPDRYADDSDNDAVARLVEAKVRALAALTAADPISRARTDAFAEVHRLNAEMRRLLPGVGSGAAERLRQAEAQLAHNALADSREYFFVMLPRPKLSALIAKARAWAASVSE